MISATAPITLTDIQNEYGTSGIVDSSTPAGLDPLPTAMLDFLGKSAYTIGFTGPIANNTTFYTYNFGSSSVGTLWIYNDGSWAFIGNGGNSFSDGTWASAGFPGGFYYWVRFTRTLQGTLPPSTSTPSTGWLRINANRFVEVYVTTTGVGMETGTASYDIEIASDSAGSNIVASRTGITLQVALETPGGGGGGGSVAVSAYMPGSARRAGAMVPGDSLKLLSLDRHGVMDGTVITNRVSEQNLVTLVSSSGIRLTCSDNTPLTLEDGTGINSTQALGHRLPVEDSQGFRWEEITAVLDAGRGPVATIFCDNQCYAAGDEPDRWIWTHNADVIVKQ